MERKDFVEKLELAMDNIVENKNYTASAITDLFKQFKMSSKCDEGWYGELMTDIIVKATAQDFESIVPKAISEKKCLRLSSAISMQRLIGMT